MCEPTVKEMLDEVYRHRRMLRHRRFFGYCRDYFSNTPLFLKGKHLLTAFRRFRFFTVFLRVLTVFLAILQTGAAVLLSTVLLLIVFPIVLLLLLGALLAAFFTSKRSNERIRLHIANRMVYVLFMTDQRNPFLLQNAQSLAARGGCVIVVSPYWISNRGLCQGGCYTTFRRELPQILLVRKYYFFTLRKYLLSSERTVYIY